VSDHLRPAPAGARSEVLPGTLGPVEMTVIQSAPGGNYPDSGAVRATGRQGMAARPREAT
jgi:hypothetical protein